MSANPTNPPPSQPPKLLDRLRGKTRLLHYSKRTEDAYADWATKYILFHGKRHPQEMGTAEIATYLTHLAVERKLAASTQNQAFAAILFLYHACALGDQLLCPVREAGHPGPVIAIKERLVRGRARSDGDFWALRDVSFDVPRGSTFACPRLESVFYVNAWRPSRIGPGDRLAARF